MPPAELPITENTITAPDGYYSLSMDLCESLHRISAPDDVPLTVLRLPGTYGHGYGGYSIVGRLIDLARRESPIRLEGGGHDRRDFLWAGDLGPIVERFVAEPSAKTVNIATGRSISIRELVDLIGHALGVNPKTEETPAGERSGSFEFDISYLRRLMPEFEPTSIEAGIAKLVNT
jgi:nucleoside-diphosphate-sugar epimerase